MLLRAACSRTVRGILLYNCIFVWFFQVFCLLLLPVHNALVYVLEGLLVGTVEVLAMLYCCQKG